MLKQIQILIPMLIIILCLFGVGYMLDSLPDASDKLTLPTANDTNMADRYNVVYNNYIQN